MAIALQSVEIGVFRAIASTPLACRHLLAEAIGLVIVGHILHVCQPKTMPISKIWGRSKLHRSVQRPSRRCCSARSANPLSRPDVTSSSNCRSHISASNFANQSQKAVSSSVDN
jgi:hypothetical protein